MPLGWSIPVPILAINDRSGSRDVTGLATQGGGVTVHSPDGRVDDDGAGNVDDSSINGLPETLWDVTNELSRSPLTKSTVMLLWVSRSRETMSQSIRRSMGSTTKGPATFDTLYDQVQLPWLTWNP